jgi:3-oxoadipate enol-lactonase
MARAASALVLLTRNVREQSVELFAHLGIARAHVAGHSVGGMIAIMLASRHPQRVDRLAVLSAAAGCIEEKRSRVMERVPRIAHDIPGDHFKNSLSRWFADDSAPPAVI